jgi:hypothetical protein
MRQHRAALGGPLLELPAGKRDIPGEDPADEPAHPPAHPHGQGGQALIGGLAEKVAARFADDQGGVIFLAELPGDGEDLALAFAPLPAGVEEEEAHRVILA